MQQHTSGVVGNLISVWLEIYCALQQWKNFANRPRTDKVIAMVRVAHFLTHSVYLHITIQLSSSYYIHVTDFQTVIRTNNKK